MDLPVPSAFFFPEYFQTSIACSFCASPLMITFLDTRSRSGMPSISHCACSITHSLHKHRWVFYSSTFYSISLVEKLPRNLDRKPSKWPILTIFPVQKVLCKLHPSEDFDEISQGTYENVYSFLSQTGRVDPRFQQSKQKVHGSMLLPK